MRHSQQVATAKEAGSATREDALEFLEQVSGPGVNFSCRARQFGTLSVWVYAGKSEKVMRQLDDVVSKAIRDFVIEHNPGEQTAIRKPDGSYEIDRQDGLGPVPLTLKTCEKPE